MAELTQKERLQPSLLDRLTDDEPASTEEPREKRVLSLRQLRASVLRDLAWLLNASAFDTVQGLDEFPEVARSVVNYGMPDLTGRTASTIDVQSLERLLRQAIVDFEPRILAKSVKVRLVLNEQEMNHNAMTFNIEGELWAQPVPLRIYLRSELDLEAGEVRLSELGAAGAG
jgi:type VI secretion system protein ImpF